MLIGALIMGGCTTVERIVQPVQVQPIIIQRNYWVPVVPATPRYQPPADLGEA